MTDAKRTSAKSTTTTGSTTPDPDPATTAGDTTPAAPLAATDQPTRADGLPVDIPMDGDRIVPTPGDPRTEPVATAEQSHVAGRVGPRTIAEDATSVQPAGEYLTEVEPGVILADTPEGPGPVPAVLPEDPTGEHLARLSEVLDGRTDRKVPGPVQADPELERLRRP